jgi:hypothetical protein
MSTKKPKKRLVGWKQYAWTTWAKGIGYSGSTVVTCCGVGFLFLGLILLWQGFQKSVPMNDMSIVMGGVGCCFGSFLTIWYATTLFKDARQIEPVELITKHNVKDLPEVETLVRGSDRSPTDQQAELLRPAGQGAETPSEQLLRATQGHGQDV